MIGPSTRLNQSSLPPVSRYGERPPGTDGQPGALAGAHRHLQAAAPADGNSRTMPRPDGDGKAAAAASPVRHEPSPSGDVSRLLSLLADKTRLKILRILAGGERPVVALTAELRLPQPTVSHHLAWLRMMDLVSPRRQGKHVFYALGPCVQHDGDGTMTLRAADATVTIRSRAAQ